MTDEIGPKRVLIVLLLALLAGISSQFLSIGVELRLFASVSLIFALVIIIFWKQLRRSEISAQLSRDQFSFPQHQLDRMNMETFKTIISPMQEGVIIIKGAADDGEVYVANHRAAEILGRDMDNMTGMSLIRAALDASLLEVAREASGDYQEIILPGGKTLSVAAISLPSSVFISDPHGQEISTDGLLLTMLDLSEQRFAERARADLVGNISHELRTPITAARLLAETIESETLDLGRRKKFHRSLLAELNRLSRMVERLVKLSRIESREEEFSVTTFPIEELLVTAVDNMLPISAAAGVELLQTEQAESMSRLDLEMSGDFDRLLEVLSNFIDNAISVSQEGSKILLNANIRRSEAASSVTFEVIDQGPGVSPADRTRVFERFYTGDVARNSEQESMGLGLAIAKHIVERHRGIIGVRDSLETGSVFFFELPLGTSNDEVSTKV